ncbi:hypothetical protein ACFO3D_05675 [Virgibacillus kekensis]|uniref:Uncharacterized protein n=1 Tax=Virgibacillus kekensis TaxID=202261 RepID=A0ABV9DIN0_9BACI
MDLQRAGVAGSPEVHFVPTSSRSAGLNGGYLQLDQARCIWLYLLSQRLNVQPCKAVFARML